MRSLKLEDNKILIDGVPLLRNLSITHVPLKRLARFKWEYLVNEGTAIGMGAHPVDVSFAYDYCVDGLKGGVAVYGEDDISKLKFDLNFSFNIISMKFTVKGTVGRDKVNTRITNPLDIFKLLQPILIGKNS